MIIRQASAEDYPEIVRIYNQAVSAGGLTGDEHLQTLDKKRAWLEQHNGRHYDLFVAQAGEEIRGYLALSPYRYGRPAFFNTAEISYYVDENYHRQGIASRLLDHALDACEKLEINTLIAILLSGNQASITLLEKNGFREWGCMPQIGRLQNGMVDHLYYGKHLREL